MNNYITLELDHPFHNNISAYEYESNVLFAKFDNEMLNHTRGTIAGTDLIISIRYPEKFQGLWVYNGDMMHPVTPYGDSGLIFRKKQEKEEIQPVRHLTVTRSV